MPFTYLPATLQDTDFVTSLVMSGARKGHFYHHLANNKTMLRQLVQSIISLGVQGSSGLFSEAMVGWNGNTRVGATIIIDTEKKDNSIELAVIIVKKEFQGDGLGRMMLDALLKRWLSYKTIYARCFPVSEKLVQMLLNRNFSIVQITSSGTRILKRKQEIHPQHGGDSPIFHAA